MTSLEQVNGTSYDGKYAKKYFRYLVGVADDKNDAWWTWSFNNEYKNKKNKDDGDGFSDASIKDGKKLKEACKSAYGGGETPTSGKVSVTHGTDTKNYKEEYIWLFCSPLGEKPKTIKDLNETKNYESKKAKDKEQDLISVEEGKNTLFWKIRNKEFYGLEGFEKITVSDTDKYFSEAQKKSDQEKQTIRDICKNAYDKDSNAGGTDDPNPDKLLSIVPLI